MPANIIKTAAALSVAAIFASAQSPGGRITGNVKDQTGAVVRKALVAVINTETGVKRETESNRQGVYDVPLLPPGNYRMLVRKQGFKPISRGGIVLNVDQVARIDFVLDVGLPETMNASPFCRRSALDTPVLRILKGSEFQSYRDHD